MRKDTLEVKYVNNRDDKNEVYTVYLNEKEIDSRAFSSFNIGNKSGEISSSVLNQMFRSIERKYDLSNTNVPKINIEDNEYIDWDYLIDQSRE